MIYLKIMLSPRGQAGGVISNFPRYHTSRKQSNEHRAVEGEGHFKFVLTTIYTKLNCPDGDS